MGQPLVFISHSSDDRDFAQELAVTLRSRNVQVWIDQEWIHFGDSVPGKISEGLASSDAVIVLVSRSFVESSWCRAEYEPVLSKEIEEDRVYVIPIRLDGSDLPPLLSRKSYVDLTTGMDEAQVQRLCDEIWDAYSDGRAKRLVPDDRYAMSGLDVSLGLLISKILSDLPVSRLASERRQPHRSLIELYRAVDRLVDRFQALLDEVSRILVRCGGKDLYFPMRATPEERHDVTIANRKLLAIARDMRDISASISDVYREKDELGEQLRLIGQICTTISEVEGNVCLKFGFPPEVPADSQLANYDEDSERYFWHHHVPGIPLYANMRWTSDDDATLRDLDEYRRELRSAIAEAISEASEE